MERIGDEVRRELGRFGPQAGMPDLLAVWPDAVGEMIAANAWPARIARDGSVHVNTASSAWAFELTQLAPAICERLRELLGERAPNALRFSVGHLPEPEPPPPDPARKSPLDPTPEALEQAAELAAAIEDEGLREWVARAAALSLSNRPSDHSF